MQFEGQMLNGKVVFETPPDVEDGTAVRVEPLGHPADSPRRGSREAILQATTAWAGDAAELDRLLANLRSTKQEELASSRDDQ